MHNIRAQQDTDQKFIHEFVNILTPVVGISELLMLRVKESGDPDIIRFVQALRDSAMAAQDLVLRFREIQDLEQGRRQLMLRKGNLKQLLESTTRSIASTPIAKELHIESSYSVDDAQVEMDFDLLPTVFDNTIRNAVEHVASESDLNERNVLVNLTTDGTDYFVRISNPGAPVPIDRIASFFDKFNSDRRRKPSGAGLGTTSARLITWAHGGRIWVQSDDQCGTVVTISLPKAGA